MPTPDDEGRLMEGDHHDADSGMMFRPVASRPTEFPSIPGLEPIGVIGRGAYSTVWSARQIRPVDRTVAVKVLDADHLGPEPLARFLREWDALARAAGTGVAALLDAGHASDGRAYLVMELVEGESITAACDRRSMPLRDRLRIAADLAGIIARIHARGLVHRDVKPSNVLVRFEADRPIVTLLDFGLASIMGRSADEGLTLPGVPIGTPEWMAPEQTGLLAGPIDERADVFALGLIVERLWTGRPRWTRRAMDQESLRSSLRAVVDGSLAPGLPMDPAPHWDDLDASSRVQCSRLIAEATRIDPTQRTIGAGDIEATLCRLAHTPTTTSKVPYAWISLLVAIGLVLVAAAWLNGGAPQALPAATKPGELVMWGRNDDGRCGLPVDRSYVSIACGPTWSLAVDEQGCVVGSGAPESPALPVPINLVTGRDRARMVTTRADGAVVLLEDGRLQAWGPMDHPDRDTSGIASVSCARRSIIAVRDDGTIDVVAHEDGGMKSPPPIVDVRSVRIAHKTAVAITASGECYAWGSNETRLVDQIQGIAVRDAAMAGTDSRTTCFVGIRPDGSLILAGSGPGLAGAGSSLQAKIHRVIGAQLASWFLLEHDDGTISFLGAAPASVRDVPPTVGRVGGPRIHAMAASTEHAAVILAR